MDQFDRATEKEERDRELAIAVARARNLPIKYTGHCLYCNAELLKGRFCPQEDCGEQWEREQKMLKIRGKK